MGYDAIGEARTNAERIALFDYGILLGERFKRTMDTNNISPLFSVTRCEEAELGMDLDAAHSNSKVFRLVMQGQQAVQPLKVRFCGLVFDLFSSRSLTILLQISDFEYRGLLGHGGYGSVHLT